MKYIFFLALFVLTACNENGTLFKSEKAELSEEQFINIYEDVLLLENYYQTKYGLPNNYKEALEKSCSMSFRKHHVTKKAFEQTYDFYARNPRKLKTVQEKIINRLNKKKL